MSFGSFKRVLQSQLHGQPLCRNFHASTTLNIYKSSVLCGMPMKRKVKIDPRIAQEADQKRRRQIDKQMKKLESVDRILKPIDEIANQRTLKTELKLRDRKSKKLTFEETLLRQNLVREWGNYRYKEHVSDMVKFNSAIKARKKALEELRKVSEDLYVKAIQIDEDMKTYSFSGPTATPPIKQYNFPDGQYIETTKKW